jgi:MYXO-CTERM domain-containing protein
MLLLGVALAGTSQLWGEQGELYEPGGRLPDFSWAGYAAGEAELPQDPVTASVLDFGAVPDDGLDDHAAFQAALDAGGVIEVPAGTWRIEDVLEIRTSDTVLRGEGSQSVLQLPHSLTELRGEAAQWAWNGGLIWVQGPGLGGSLTETGEALRGEVRLPVADTSGLSPGQLVVLKLVDEGDSLGTHLHDEQDEPGDCDYQVPLGLSWPVRVEAVGQGEVTLAQPLRTDVRADWQPTLYALDALSEVGVEHLALEFPEVEYAGHLDEPGYNGVFFEAGVADSWVRDVSFHNADSGLLVDALTKHITGTGLVFTGRQGHHGLNVAHSHDGLYTGLVFDAYFVHHMTVDHRASGNVFSRVSGQGQPIHMDHHRDSPFENLWTAIVGEVDLIHGGSWCAGPPSGARSTFWGLEGELIPPYWAHIQTNLVGPSIAEGETRSEHGAWIEDMETVEPRNLHLAQRARRLGLDYQDTGLSEEAGEPTPEDSCGCKAGPAAGLAPMLLGLLALRRRRHGVS